MDIARLPYGELPDGRSVELYVLSNASGLAARVMTYGSTLVALHAPDRDGLLEDIVLGFDSLEGYLSAHPYFGGTIGRYANRIAQGRYTLDGVPYRLACNDGPNHLHGGVSGFDKRLWTARVRTLQGVEWLDMEYTSADGEEGYPGTLTARASYTVSDVNELTIAYEARCDRKTIVNLTSHAYFDLAGHGDVLDHEFRIPGRQFLPVDDTLIPTGELRPVESGPMDFTQPASLRERIGRNDPQLIVAGGYDHTWVLPDTGGKARLAARVHEPSSGRVLEIETTQPGVQFYSGNRLDGSITGKGGRRYAKHAGFCLEPHRFPDAPNRPSFPSAVLEPGRVYAETTLYRFRIEDEDDEGRAGVI